MDIVSALLVSLGSDLADQRQRGLQRLAAGLPARRAHFTRMRGDVLRGLHLAQQFLGVAADAEVMDFLDLDLARTGR